MFLMMAVAAGDWKGWVALRKNNRIAELFSMITWFEENEFRQEVIKEPQIVAKVQKLKRIGSLWHEVRCGVATYLKWIGADLSKGIASRVIMTAACYSQILMPGFTFMFLIIKPCSVPSFLRSTLSDCPPRGGFPTLKASSGMKILFLTLDGYATAHGVSQGSTAIASYFYVGVVCLRGYITRIKNELESKAEKVSVDTIRRHIEAYKRVKILETYYNKITQSGIVPVIMVDMANLGIMSIASLIALHDTMSLPQMLLVIVIASDVVIFIQFCMYQAAGEVYQRSNEIRDIWEHNVTIQKDKCLRRCVTACNSIKIRMGDSGFMEKVTPLAITLFTMEQAISLVLMTRTLNLI